MAFSDATVEAKWFFQFVFCAVSLAIVWGTTLERIEVRRLHLCDRLRRADLPRSGSLGVRRRLAAANIGMQDFAGSTAVHLIGASGGLAVLLLLGARKGKYRRRRQATADPGALDAPVRSRRADLWLGWFGFNPTALGALDGASPRSSWSRNSPARPV